MTEIATTSSLFTKIKIAVAFTLLAPFIAIGFVYGAFIGAAKLGESLWNALAVWINE